jgi:ABC-2 type transport system ATP-binding protein
MLTLDAVSKTFGAVRAVDALSFEVNPGEIFALLGPNGAGKSTTLRMIAGIIDPDEGRIIRSHPFTNDRLQDAARMSYMPEERGLYRDISIADTILYFGRLRGLSPEQARSAARYWLERFEIADRVKEKLNALSKGNQQKVQFITAILHNPALAILDEPFSGFDPINQELFSDVIRELRNTGMAILLSAHQMDLVERIADRILLLRNGKTARFGTIDEFRRQASASERVKLVYQEVPDAEVLAELANLGSVSHDGTTVSVAYAETVLLHPILEIAGRAGHLVRVHTEHLSLHQLYLASFETDTAKSPSA